MGGTSCNEMRESAMKDVGGCRMNQQRLDQRFCWDVKSEVWALQKNKMNILRKI